MFSRDDVVLIGVSGGPDSVFLLHFLWGQRERLGIILYVAHLNHGFRREAEREAEFVREMSVSLGLHCTVKTIDCPSYAREKRLSRQEAARQVRYSFLREVASEIGANKIALAHTSDDQAETFFMRMIRGAGSRGLGGISPLREKTIVRPLIEISRKEIIDHLRENGVPFIEDPSNISPVYLRNRLRHELIPLIEKDYNPRIKKAFVRTAEILRDEDSFLEDYCTRIMPKLISHREEGKIKIFLKPFLYLDRAIQRRVLRRVIEELKGDLKGYSSNHIVEAIDSIAHGQTGRKICLPKKVIVERDYSVLSVYLEGSTLNFAQNKTQDSRYDVSVPGVTHIPKFDLTLYTEIISKGSRVELGNSKEEASFDFEKIHGKIQVGKRKEGDFFSPIGMAGRRKKLKKYFIDEKIRRDERDGIPILTEGENILWIIGYRQDERYKVDTKTKTVLFLRAERGSHADCR